MALYAIHSGEGDTAALPKGLPSCVIPHVLTSPDPWDHGVKLGVSQWEPRSHVILRLCYSTLEISREGERQNLQSSIYVTCVYVWRHKHVLYWCIALRSGSIPRTINMAAMRNLLPIGKDWRLIKNKNARQQRFSLSLLLFIRVGYTSICQKHPETCSRDK